MGQLWIDNGWALKNSDLKKRGQRFDVVKMPKLCPGVLLQDCHVSVGDTENQIGGPICIFI